MEIISVSFFLVVFFLNSFESRIANDFKCVGIWNILGLSIVRIAVTFMTVQTAGCR